MTPVAGRVAACSAGACGSWLMGMSAQNRPMTGGPFRWPESAPGQYDGQGATVLWERALAVCRSRVADRSAHGREA